MQKLFLLVFFLFSIGLSANDKSQGSDAIKVLNSGTPAEIQASLNEMFPKGADLSHVVEVGDDRIVDSVQAGLPVAAASAALSDEAVGNHFNNETVNPLSNKVIAKQPKLSWRMRLIIARIVCNGGIAALLIALKNHVHGENFQYDRMAANFAVHGGVNGLFQIFGLPVANFAYSNWSKAKFFPNFQMRLKDLLWRNLTRAWPKRVLLTISSVLVYKMTDFAFTGKFDTSLVPLISIAMNIAAALAPAAIALEMGARIGPAQAQGLPARNTKVFDIQNFVISVLFAVGLLANTEEMNQTFGVHGVWYPLYSAVAIGGVGWWAAQSRWTNPELLPARTFFTQTAKKAVRYCGNAIASLWR